MLPHARATYIYHVHEPVYSNKCIPTASTVSGIADLAVSFFVSVSVAAAVQALSATVQTLQPIPSRLSA
jgi:hypothetical protein